MTDVDMARLWPFRTHWRQPSGDIVTVVARANGKLLVEHIHGHDPIWVTTDTAQEWQRIGDGL